MNLSPPSDQILVTNEYKGNSYIYSFKFIMGCQIILMGLVGVVLDYYDTCKSLINNYIGLHHSTWDSRDDA